MLVDGADEQKLVKRESEIESRKHAMVPNKALCRVGDLALRWV